MGIVVNIPDYMNQEMLAINKHLSKYPGYKAVASSLGKIIPQNLVAGLIGCIIPESGSDHSILNAAEYRGNGVSGTYGWNCGEGLVQWTFWKYKEPLIKLYNADSRSTQKLPTTWEQYRQGTPVTKNGTKQLYAPQDGRHIAGLTLDNQMLFLTIYYSGLINELKDEENLAVIVAKIYQKKAGSGFYQNLKHDPVLRAYTTSKNKYPSKAGNHYLQSLKIAAEYIDAPIEPASVPPMEGETVYTSYEYTPGTSSGSVTPSEIANMNSGKKERNQSGVILGYHMRQK